MTAADAILIIGGLVTLVGSISAAAVAVIRAMQEGQNKLAAAAAITAEQQNRYLATRGAEPVTMLSPPMGTGDGSIDKAVTNQLANAPTSPTTVPVTPPVVADAEKTP